MTGIAGWGALAGGLAQGATSTYEGIKRSQYGFKGSKEVEADIAGHKAAGDELEKLLAANPNDEGLQRLVAINRAYNGGGVPKVTATGAGVDPSKPPGSNPVTAAPGGATPSASLSGSSTAPGNTDQMYP